MAIKKIILLIVLIFACADLGAVEQSLTLEQRILTILQKYHIGENQWILNAIMAALPIYCVTKNAQEFIILLDQNFGIMEVICPSCPKDFLLQATAIESIVPAQEQAVVTTVSQGSTDAWESGVTSFHFGMMSAFLILIHAAIGVCSGQ